MPVKKYERVSTGVELEERRRKSAESLARYREKQEAEYLRQLELPTVEDKFRAIATAVAALADLINGDEARLIASDLLETIDKETRSA